MATAKVAIVTGGASGFGGRLTELLLDKGWNVLIADRDKTKGTALAESLASRYRDPNAKPGAPPRAVFVAADLSDMEAVKGVFDSCLSTYGAFDAVVNNAGIGDADGYYLGKRLTDGTKWRATIEVNVNAVLYGTQLAIKHYKERKKKGAVVNTGSIGAFQTSTVQPIYNATKAFVVMFTRCHKHFAADGIRVNVVCPGPSPTPMFLAGKKVARLGETFEALSSNLVSIDTVAKAMLIALEDESLAGEAIRATADGIDVFNPDTLESRVIAKL
ncbi:hypothetical protein DFJ74DRAFT_763364 [Hyaloraphidium curvatum]|nr:hypothetical protein DFJ74DRAFT_763364 [Hyaloraphidium curvatum]